MRTDACTAPSMLPGKSESAHNVSTQMCRHVPMQPKRRCNKESKKNKEERRSPALFSVARHTFLYLNVRRA